MIEKIDTERCTGCGICIDVCPLDVLRIENLNGEKKAFIAYPDDCMTCFFCELSCPFKAISVHPFKEIISSPLYPIKNGD